MTKSALKAASQPTPAKTIAAVAAANEVLLIGGDGKLPVIDGSNLTGINAGLSRAEICAIALVL